jgi:hypothetical protein
VHRGPRGLTAAPAPLRRGLRSLPGPAPRGCEVRSRQPARQVDATVLRRGPHRPVGTAAAHTARRRARRAVSGLRSARGSRLGGVVLGLTRAPPPVAKAAPRCGRGRRSGTQVAGGQDGAARVAPRASAPGAEQDGPSRLHTTGAPERPARRRTSVRPGRRCSTRGVTRRFGGDSRGRSRASARRRPRNGTWGPPGWPAGSAGGCFRTSVRSPLPAQPALSPDGWSASPRPRPGFRLGSGARTGEPGLVPAGCAGRSGRCFGTGCSDWPTLLPAWRQARPGRP